MASGVATRPIADLKAYRAQLQRYVYTSGTVMQPVFAAAAEQADQAHRLRRGRGRPGAARGPGRGRRAPGAAGPGRPARGRSAPRSRISACGSSPGRDYEVASFDDEALIGPAAEAYYQLGRRRGLERDFAAAEMRRNGTLIGAMLVREGRADGMLCGTFGPYAQPPEATSPRRSACARASTTSRPCTS